MYQLPGRGADVHSLVLCDGSPVPTLSGKLKGVPRCHSLKLPLVRPKAVLDAVRVLRSHRDWDNRDSVTKGDAGLARGFNCREIGVRRGSRRRVRSTPLGACARWRDERVFRGVILQGDMKGGDRHPNRCSLRRRRQERGPDWADGLRMPTGSTKPG